MCVSNIQISPNNSFHTNNEYNLNKNILSILITKKCTNTEIYIYEEIQHIYRDYRYLELVDSYLSTQTGAYICQNQHRQS